MERAGVENGPWRGGGAEGGSGSTGGIKKIKRPPRKRRAHCLINNGKINKINESTGN